MTTGSLKLCLTRWFAAGFAWAVELDGDGDDAERLRHRKPLLGPAGGRAGGGALT